MPSTTTFQFTSEARAGWAEGRLSIRPGDPRLQPEPAPEGGGVLWPLGREPGAPMLLVPAGLPDTPLPLVVLLHGAGGDPAGMLPFLQREAEERGVLVLAPKSAGPTWDVLRGGFGPDVTRLDEALAAVFGRFLVDPDRLAVAGFSDGASYALSIGLINGFLFSRVMAFSPGFIVAPTRDGRPSIFVSHGTADPVLPIDRCSRRLVPVLRAEGYDVDYREFAGGHEVPPEMARAALDPVP
jgi:phospholipase/carboxylesterase